jgi:PPM family protein phosphatase
MLRVAEHWSGSDTGMQRRANEDSLLVRTPLFVVADGMGGAQAGEVASHMAVESFKDGLPDRSDPRDGLVELARQANARINERSRSDPRHAGMGTTITAAYVGERDVSIVHVGDSRAYCLRDGELLRLTDDHSLVDELIRQGRLTPEEAEEHPQRSVITRALGPEPSVEIDARSFRGRAGDVYLLCSDGLTTMVGEDELAHVLLGHERLRDAGEALIAAANEAGGKDNITVVLARLEEVASRGAPDGDGRATIVGPEAPHDAPTTASMPILSAPPGETPVSSGGSQVPSEGSPAARTSGGAPTSPGGSRVPSGGSPDPVAQTSGGARSRQPRAAGPAPRARERRRGGVRGGLRRARLPLVALALIAAIVAGGYVASQSVFFIGTNGRGLVTVFRGVPFELPGGLKLYSSDYVSGVSASTLPAARRQTLLDHSLRSERDAADLVRQLELGELSER